MNVTVAILGHQSQSRTKVGFGDGQERSLLRWITQGGEPIARSLSQAAALQGTLAPMHPRGINR
jgi:hypothetical protein